MTTLFSAALGRMGMDYASLAVRLRKSKATIRAYADGRRNVPDDVWPAMAEIARERGADLRSLAREIEARIRKAA